VQERDEEQKQKRIFFFSFHDSKASSFISRVCYFVLIKLRGEN
jgi:hypothetical protein